MGMPRTIREVLLPALQQQFPDRVIRTGAPPDPVAVFPAAHPEVGDCIIWDDGNEATVGVGEITHGHFNPYDESRSPDAIAVWVTQAVVAFLVDLLADRVLLWSASNGRTGGWTYAEEGAADLALPVDAQLFVWSGPAQRNQKYYRSR
jgi:hypothetical protein